MLQLRLEALPSEDLSGICNQATRIATLLGVEVVFKYREQDFIAKPGMSPESCLHELLNKYEMPAVIAEKPADAKTTGKKGKQKDQASAETPVVNEADVQKEGI